MRLLRYSGVWRAASKSPTVPSRSWPCKPSMTCRGRHRHAGRRSRVALLDRRIHLFSLAPTGPFGYAVVMPCPDLQNAAEIRRPRRAARLGTTSMKAHGPTTCASRGASCRQSIEVSKQTSMARLVPIVRSSADDPQRAPSQADATSRGSGQGSGRGPVRSPQPGPAWPRVPAAGMAPVRCAVVEGLPRGRARSSGGAVGVRGPVEGVMGPRGEVIFSRECGTERWAGGLRCHPPQGPQDALEGAVLPPVAHALEAGVPFGQVTPRRCRAPRAWR